MKRITLLLLLVFAACYSRAQKQYNQQEIITMMQGRWVSSDDTTFSITITGDTATESRPGSLIHYRYTISKESCDPDALIQIPKKSTTGYFIDETSRNGGIEFCNALISIDSDEMIWYYSDGPIDLQRKK